MYTTGMKRSQQASEAGEVGGLLARVAGAELSAAERRLVNYLLSVPDYDLASTTSAELALRTSTSRSTIDRLARRFGFAGHRELRNGFLQDSHAMRATVGSSGPLDPEIRPGDSSADVAFKVFNSASVRALRFSELLASSNGLDALVEALLSARAIRLFGAGASAVVAMDLHQRLLRLGLAITFDGDAHTQIALAALMRPGDLAIAISYSGRTKSTLRAVEVACSQGARVAAILGAVDSPIAAAAELRILTPPGVGLFGNDAVMTRILQMMFNEVLFHCLALRSGDLLDNAQRIDTVLNEEKVGGTSRGPTSTSQIDRP